MSHHGHELANKAYLSKMATENGGHNMRQYYVTVTLCIVS